MLPVYSGGHAAYQDFVAANLRKYYPDPDSISRATWDIIDRFWNLDFSFTDERMKSKYSVSGPRPRTPSCMQRPYLLSIDFKTTSILHSLKSIHCTPFLAVLMLAILREQAPFTTSSPAYGILMMIISALIFMN